jgi:uncharacterized protein YbjQ (UPF0145 family)
MTTHKHPAKPAKPAEKGEKEFVLSRHPEKAMQEMVQAIEALRAFYAEENAALLAADTKLFMTMQDRKIRVVKNYHAGVQQIIARRDEFTNISPVLRRHLHALHEDFTRVTDVNLKALERMTKSVQRLGARIMHAARESVQKKSVNYGKSGNINKIERAVSIGFSESA